MELITNQTTVINHQEEIMYTPKRNMLREAFRQARMLFLLFIAIVAALMFSNVITENAMLTAQNSELSATVSELRLQVESANLTAAKANETTLAVTEAVSAVAVGEVRKIASENTTLTVALLNEKALLVKEANKGCTDKLLESGPAVAIGNGFTSVKDTLVTSLGM